jgi:hypothetical protein
MQQTWLNSRTLTLVRYTFLVPLDDRSSSLSEAERFWSPLFSQQSGRPCSFLDSKAAGV